MRSSRDARAMEKGSGMVESSTKRCGRTPRRIPVLAAAWVPSFPSRARPDGVLLMESWTPTAAVAMIFVVPPTTWVLDMIEQAQGIRWHHDDPLGWCSTAMRRGAFTGISGVQRAGG